MIIGEQLPFIKTFIEELNNGLGQCQPGCQLTKTQKYWLGFCLLGLVLTNSVCWAKFERASLGAYSLAALCWMFRQSKLPWAWLLGTSTRVILKTYGIKEGKLVIDDSDRRRSKYTKRVFKTYKQKDKSSGGYVNGQTIVLLLLVTSKVTLPVGFAFYMPDPKQTAWRKQEKRLKKQKVAKQERPAQPAPDPTYPTKPQLALNLLRQFKAQHGDVKVTVMSADALYGQGPFMDEASALFGGIQVISQIRHNQNIHFRGKKRSVKAYFKASPGSPQKIRVRGGKTITATISSARLYLDAHGKKRFLMALKYDGEKEYRYLVATDLSWRTIDIVQAYTLRWLVEVFFEDWKLYEGWGQEATQFDEEGSSRGLILSLLLDHCLLLHPEQQARLGNNLPAYTVGSLQRRTQMEALLMFVHDLLHQENPGQKLKELGAVMDEVFRLRPSDKHMSGRPLGRMEPTPSLRYRALAA